MKYFILFIFLLNLIIKNGLISGISLKEKQCNYINLIARTNGDPEGDITDCCDTPYTLCEDNEIIIL